MLRYSEQLLHYFHHTTHQGELVMSLPGVMMAKVGSSDNQECLQLMLQIENGVIVQARFLAIGSVAIIGGAQWLCDFLLYKRSDEVYASLTIDSILQSLQLPSVKVHVAQLLLSAVKQCVGKHV